MNQNEDVNESIFEIEIYDYTERGGETQRRFVIPTEAFLRNMKCETMNEFYDKIVDGVDGKTARAVSRLRKDMSSTKETLAEAVSTINRFLNTQKTLEKATADARTIIGKMKDEVERYQAVKRQPNDEAHSVSPDADTWVCSMCGTVMGRMSLYGKDGVKWRKQPRFCPGCGAVNTDVMQEEELRDQFEASALEKPPIIRER